MTREEALTRDGLTKSATSAVAPLTSPVMEVAALQSPLTNCIIPSANSTHVAALFAVTASLP